jgi:uncharacterized membrane protein YhaH (DUF805 family)
MLLAAGAVVLFARKSAHHGWDDFALLLVVSIPTILLYLLGLGLFERPSTDCPRPSQSLIMVAAILLWPIALLQFLQCVGARPSHPLYLAGVFALTALLAAYAAHRARIRYAALLAGIASLFVWFYLWQKILHHPSANTARWLIVAAGALLLICAAGLERAKAVGAGEVATAGGIAAVGAGVFGVIVGGVVAAFRPLFTLGETVNAHGISTSVRGVHAVRPVNAEDMPPAMQGLGGPGGPPRLLHGVPIMPRHLPGPHGTSSLQTLTHAVHTCGLQHLGWDIYLLVVSVALICGAGLWRIRGLGYVGGIGLLAFIVSVAAQLTRVEVGRAPTGSIVGWPLVLIVIGLVGLAAPALHRRGT